jgi:hypothetical protein
MAAVRLPRSARRPALSSLAALAVLASPSPCGAEDDIAIFPVEIAMATDDMTPVQSAAWVDEQLAHAEALYGPHGVHFRRVGLRNIDEDAAHVETRADRDRLVAACKPGVINVVVVETLKDVDEADRFRFGVHWRNEADPHRRYIVLSAAAPPTVLAHELGHYFGNAHSTVPNNVMSYVRTPGEPVFLDEAQIRMVRAKAREALATREILAVPAAPR